MEEKKTVKKKLPIVFLILAILVIMAMGYFICKLYQEKETANAKAGELTQQVSELEGTVENLQEEIDHFSDTTNTTDNTEETVETTVETTVENNVPANTNANQTFSTDEIKTALQDYLNLKGILAGSPEELLVYLELLTYEDNTEIVREIVDEYYIKTSIPYSEYKNKMLQYMTEQWFESNFTDWFKNKDGYLYYFYGGGSGMIFEVESITINEKGPGYIANVYNVHFDDSREQETFEFQISDYNGNCVISYCEFKE